MPRNPLNGEPATLCTCGHWNNWKKNHDTPNSRGRGRFFYPHQCDKCGRQLIQKHNPDRKRQSASDQASLLGQRNLSHFGGKKCKKK